MVSKDLNQKDWSLSILGWLLFNVGTIFHYLVPSPIDSIGLLITISGIHLVFMRLRRSMVVGLARLFCAGYALQLGALMARWPLMGQSLFAWMVLFALLVGVVGPAVPVRARGNAFGVILATVWVLLLGAVMEASRAREFSKLFAFFLFAGALGWLTHLYTRWTKGKELPASLTKWYWELPDDSTVSPEAPNLSGPENDLLVSAERESENPLSRVVRPGRGGRGA